MFMQLQYQNCICMYSICINIYLIIYLYVSVHISMYLNLCSTLRENLMNWTSMYLYVSSMYPYVPF